MRRQEEEEEEKEGSKQASGGRKRQANNRGERLRTLRRQANRGKLAAGAGESVAQHEAAAVAQLRRAQAPPSFAQKRCARTPLRSLLSRTVT